ncbi:STAS domain-containing protein [Streptomyces tricolor]|uniref:STAS domain-containing protein n=1 Tax=Streptomyces tricolor TaxID=68277 RepID=UPI0036E4B26D
MARTERHRRRAERAPPGRARAHRGPGPVPLRAPSAPPWEDAPVPQAALVRHQPHRGYHRPPPHRLRRGSPLVQRISPAGCRSCPPPLRHLCRHPAGDIGHHTGDTLRQALDIPDGDQPRIVIDRGQVAFMDSSGINVLIAAHRRLTEAGGWLRLTAPTGSVLRTPQIVGVDTLIDCRDILRDAVST